METQRLVAVDLDGTLLDPGGKLTDRSADSVRAAAAAGFRMVIATGRPPHMVADLADRLAGAVGHVVATNGSIISTFPGEPDGQPELLHLLSFDIERATSIIADLRAHDDRIGFAFATDAGFAHEPGFADRMPAAVHDPAVADALVLSGTTAFKLFAFHPEVEAADLMTQLMPVVNRDPNAEAFAVGHMGADAVEIGPATTDKSAGLRWLCDHLGVERDDVIAIGDELNDLTMIEWAGTGVAMAGAPPAVKAVADIVIGTNTDDAVAQYLDDLVSGV